MKKFIIIMMLIIITMTSCGKDDNNVKIGNNGVDVNVDGTSVNIGENGIDVNSDGTNASIGKDGIEVNSSGSNVKIGENGVEVNASGANVKISGNEISVANLQIGGNVSDLSDEDKYQFGELSEEVLEVEDCKAQFDQLINAFGNDYSSCKLAEPRNANCDEQNLDSPKVNVVIIFDASGSMKAQIGDEYMIDIAKQEVENYISSLDSNIGGAVIVYGQEGDSSYAKRDISCKGIDNIGTFSNKSSLISRIKSIDANGWTPIDDSLKKAYEYLNSISGPKDQKVILLVSDGKETCNGNPAETAKQIASDNNTYIDVIGFNVYGDTQSSLSEIAKNGKGKYSNVRSRADFQRIFADMQAFTNEIKCGASQASVQLRTAVDSLNTYFICDYMLHEEQVKVYTNMTESCYKEIENLMESRINQITPQLNKLHNDAKNQINSYEKYLDEVLNNF